MCIRDRSDPDAVAILANLVDNALAACREGDAVSVRALVQRGVAVFEVRNPAHGDGDLPSVFRLPPHPARRHGIGLASVRRTAERYGGSLTPVSYTHLARHMRAVFFIMISGPQMNTTSYFSGCSSSVTKPFLPKLPVSVAT